jgi:aminopeptidase
LTPSPETLEKYAHVLVNFALNSGQGVRPGEVVRVSLPECAKPFYVPLRNTILRAGAIPLMQFLADDVAEADVFSLANATQLEFFLEPYYRGLVDQCDHTISIIAEFDKFELTEVEPVKLMQRQVALKPLRQWWDAKESAGNYTWTLAMYGTPAMAKEANMTLDEYWAEIIAACYLDSTDPVARWKQTAAELERIRLALTALMIEKVHVEGENVDLWVGLGADRQWLGGSGRNIPSFELFISPDWRGTEGAIVFNQPLYRYGNLIEGIKLRFERGMIVEATASANQELLQAMIQAENADKIGEFSLTDGRFSRITKTMGETLFDENIGGPHGNTHLAVGNAYKDSFRGDASAVTSADWKRMGFNESAVHTDIVSTERRTVTAWLPDGSQCVIYQDGQFTL